MTICRLFQTEEFADENFKLDENGRKFSKRVENTVGKKNKLLVMSNFSFSNSVFYLFEELSCIYIKLKNVVCKLFQFGRV